MAGVGEASAILTITQFGFTFASRLADFIGDYKDAGNLMKTISDEVEATSTPLQQLGELIKQNGLQNPKAVSDAASLARRFNITISEIRSILKMDDISLDGTSSNKETALSKRDRLRWASLSKSKLEIPRAQLGRLKMEMTLLYLTLMTMKSKSEEDRKRFESGIPGLTKKLRWANAQYDELIRQQAESSQEEDVVRVTRRNRQPFRRRLAKEDERKHLEEYREFLQRQSAERRETLRQQALALQEKEREQQRKEEEKKRKEIEDAAILAYKSQIKEQEEKAERDKKQLEEELEKLLNKVGVEDDKIDQVLKELKPPMTVNHISVESSEGPVEAQPEPHLQNSAVDVVERRSFLARMLGRARQPPDENVKPFLPPNQSNLLASHVKVEEDPSILEAWIISHWANSIHYAPISGQMLADMLDARKRPKREKPLLERFALLDPKYQDSIVSLCHDRSSKSRYGWMLIYLNETREWKKGGRWKRAKEFTHIQVVLKQRSHQMDDVVEVHEAKGSPLNPHDKKDDPYSGISNTAPTGPKPAPNGSSDFRSTKDVFHSGKHDQKHETVTRRRRYRYKGGSDDSKEPLLAEWVDAWVDILEVNRNIPAMLRPRTEIFKDAIDVRALVESGFEFTEKDDRFVVAAHLDVTELDKLYELTKDIRGVGDIPENPASLPISVGPVTKKPRVSWDIHEPGVSHAGDLHPDGRPKRSSFSQPGEDGFHLSRPRSWSPPIRGANESLQRFARNSEGGRLREPYHYSHSTRDPSRLRILPPPGPSDPSIGPGFGAPPSMPYSTYEDGEEIIYRHPRRIESQAFITNPPTSHLLEYGNERVESTTRFTPEVVERVRERARQLPQREREDQERYERGRSSIEERVRERERERYERGRSSMEERVRERERERDRERDRERYERDRPRSRERYRSSHQPTLHDDDYVRPRSIIRSEVDPYYPPRREGYTDYGPRRKLILGTIEKKINLLPSRTRHGDLDNTSDDDYSSLTMDDFDAPAKTSLRLPSQPRKSRAATMSSETEEEGVAETDSAIIEKQLALYRDDQSRNQNQNTPGAVTHIVRTESEDQSVETGPKEEDPSGRASEIGNPPPERSVSPKSSSSVVSGSTEEIVPRS